MADRSRDQQHGGGLMIDSGIVYRNWFTLVVRLCMFLCICVGYISVTKAASEDRGDEFHDRIIYTEDEKISLSLELCAQ